MEQIAESAGLFGWRLLFTVMRVGWHHLFRETEYFCSPQRKRVNPQMRPYITTIVLLTCSNVFMTFAWYAHLKNLSAKPLMIAVLASWGIAFFEYLLQVPANRTGITVMQLGQLKVLQEVIALSVFVPFSILYMKQRLTLDYLWASLCIAGAAYFMFRRG